MAANCVTVLGITFLLVWILVASENNISEVEKATELKIKLTKASTAAHSFDPLSEGPPTLVHRLRRPFSGESTPSRDLRRVEGLPRSDRLDLSWLY